MRAGKVRHLGISLDPGDAKRVQWAPELGAEVIQVTYNRLNPSADKEVLPAAARIGCGVLAREPLASGYLSGGYRAGNPIAGPEDWRASRDRRQADADLEDVARLQASEVPSGVPIARWALAWCLQHPAVSAVIPGSRTLEHLQGKCRGGRA